MEKWDVYRQLPDVLLPWYRAGCRDLPWRKDKDPYHIWVSEIMLQQTRVEAVKGYYARFLETLPTIESLAKVDDEQLLKLWEGLGYYSRARNLKKAAQEVMQRHSGVFPRDYDAILALPGIGAYTAGAIGSIAFGLPTPAVDGNVLRVAARLTEDDTPIDLSAFKTSVQAHLEEVYPEDAGTFTQALMELGATVCGPNRKPDCVNCPCKAFCLGYQNGTAESLPVKNPKRQRRREARTVLILSCDGRYGLQKRPSKGLLAGMWEFPNVSGRYTTEGAVALVEKLGLQPKEILRQVERKHIFTHVEWDMSGVYMEVKAAAGNLEWFDREQIYNHAALPTAFRIFWEELENG